MEPEEGVRTIERMLQQLELLRDLLGAVQRQGMADAPPVIQLQVDYVVGRLKREAAFLNTTVNSTAFLRRHVEGTAE